MKPLEKTDGIVTELPRGGYLVEIEGGYIQFGSPPETIKDTMKLPEGVPLVFVLSRDLFNPDKGISLAELEFPIYYNFFIRGKRTIIVCTKEQSRRLIRVLREAVFGPIKIDISQDIHPAQNDVVIPDLRKEMNHYKNFRFKDLLSFLFFKKSKAAINGITITVEKNGDFNVLQNRKKMARIPGTIEYTAQYMIGKRLKEPYVPPLFGITCLGHSHGFDPTENTSGYIVWLNHRGVMIDPPVNSTEWLMDSNVNPKFIDSIILTHCHADHDAGTFQKIMEEGKITIYSTKTIFNSFLRKYSSLSQESIPYLSRLFNFHPIYLEKSFFIHGGKFKCFYTLHSIPAIGFTIDFQGRSFVYSSDHKAEPDVHEELLHKKVISRARYEQLRRFPWDSDVIYHESGVPPLHTSIHWLNSLPKKIQEKTVIYHIAKKDFPDKTSLSLAQFGIENTLYFKVKSPRFEKTYGILGILQHLDFSQGFSLEKIQEFLLAIREEHFKKGELIIQRGRQGDKFYIIYSGNVGVYVDGLQQKKIYGAFEYFGEAGIIGNKPTAADVVAETDVLAYTMAKEKFLSFISGTEFEETLKNLSSIRDEETWNILSTSRLFKRLTSYQKTWLESVLKPMEKKKGEILVARGERFRMMYIIRTGSVAVQEEKAVVATLKKGDFIGNFHEINRDIPSGYSYVAEQDIRVFAITRKDMVSFMEKNPGLIMKLTNKIDYLPKVTDYQ